MEGGYSQGTAGVQWRYSRGTVVLVVCGGVCGGGDGGGDGGVWWCVCGVCVW